MRATPKCNIPTSAKVPITTNEALRKLDSCPKIKTAAVVSGRPTKSVMKLVGRGEPFTKGRLANALLPPKLAAEANASTSPISTFDDVITFTFR